MPDQIWTITCRNRNWLDVDFDLTRKLWGNKICWAEKLFAMHKICLLLNWKKLSEWMKNKIENTNTDREMDRERLVCKKLRSFFEEQKKRPCFEEWPSDLEFEIFRLLSLIYFLLKNDDFVIWFRVAELDIHNFNWIL